MNRDSKFYFRWAMVLSLLINILAIVGTWIKYRPHQPVLATTELLWLVSLPRYALTGMTSYFLILWWQKRKYERLPAPRRISPSKKLHYYNPKEFRAERPACQPTALLKSQLDGSQTNRLLLACSGDKSLMGRLMEYERRKASFISDFEAARRAVDRLERDRR